MPLPGDPATLEALARRISHHADDMRARASRLAAAADGVRWYSAAAGAFRHDVRGLAGGFRRAADDIDDAAEALRRHAATVRHVRAVIAAAEQAAAAAARGVEHVGNSALGVAEKAGASVAHLLGI